MISQTKNRVQAIKSKFENLSSENENLIVKKTEKHLGKQEKHVSEVLTKLIDLNNSENENDTNTNDVESFEPNNSYLYSKIDSKKAVNDVKKSLTRQCSDPGKKLHRSHAFRCDRSQKITNSPKRHGSCNGRSETSDFSLKMGEKRLSKDRLKRLGNLLEDQMRKENFVVPSEPIIVGEVVEVKPSNSIPDKDVPKHILDQYAKVFKPKKNEEKPETMTDSGVSSETENLEEDKTSKIKKLTLQFEKTEADNNLEVMNDLCVSSETMRLERKNPHLTLTDTLKKALKQPLPPGPPPKKPPRIFNAIPENEKQKKDTKKMLEKLEQVLQKREALNNSNKNIYDIAETNLSPKKPKEIHYLCTEILDITQRTLLPNQNTSESLGNCFNSLNCAILTNSTASLPYTRLSSAANYDHLKNVCSCSNNSLDKENKTMSTFGGQNKCSKCMLNDEKDDRFKCHLNCNCKMDKSEFYVEKEHIYDEPFIEEVPKDIRTVRKNSYGTINSLKMNGNQSKSLEDLRMKPDDDKKIYDIPCDISRAETPDFITSSPKSEFQKLRENFENGFGSDTPKLETDNRKTSIPNDIRKFGTENTEFVSDIRKASTDKSDTILANMRKFSNDPNDLIDAKKSENFSDIKKIDTDTRKSGTEKPALLMPKPTIFIKKVSKSSENITEDFKTAKRLVEKKFGTEAKRYRNRADVGNNVFSLPKKNYTQLDVDRENVWADRKYLAKRAASAARQSASATGGGPSTAPPISDTDRRIISIMGEGFGSQQVEGRVPAFYSAREPASTASSSTAVPPEVASQDDVQLELPADEEHLGEIPHSAPPPQGSQPAETSSQNQSQALPARRVLRARRGLPANSLGPRIMALEEQRLNVEQRRLATEEAILDELRQLRLAIVAGIQQSRQQ